ncbi:prolipoprotein diacylglyceryl transferase [Alkaliphilus peptidifermentans]|uniref:Phosphatidylglycerol--prolipoprotein diacylglyceryl transferase n=1 Tax=Alkaliphilus peptidifermentans DSM 18978 TaxID=1120976 RepID=A0A1G5BFY4_9FIRM|nr:prolipoprotein diacylglyceryl transferase [Alkaliphilus peptidifermentans]SCX89067.1 phosphatidylglycerol:prolipoprotein diacylglycerol transferase [Alkaliphilus peptidifermentans DSM 18978]
MNPVAFRIVGIEIGWYGIIIAFGMLLGVLVASARAKKEGLQEDVIIDIALLAVPAALVGARLYYVLFNWQYYSQHPENILRFRQGGLAIHGGVIAGVIVGYLYCRYKNLGFWRMADICAPSIILGQAIGRWGNYVNQEAYGGPTDLPWAIEVDGVMVHPTFLYESLWNFGVFFFLLHYTKRKKYSGQIFILYVILYSIARFFIEGLRTDSLMIGPLRTAQVVSLALIAGAFVISSQIRKKGY